MSNQTWKVKLSDGSEHLYLAIEFWNASHMALQLKENQFPQSEIIGIEKHSDDAIEGAWKYPFKI
jgi:hypothetical protein